MENAVVITCKACGHRELDSQAKELMAKIRMWNHIHHAHPALVDEFRQITNVRHGVSTPEERPREEPALSYN